MKYRSCKLVGVAVTVLVSCNLAAATVWNVSNVSQLNTAIGGLGYGDEVILAPGTYDIATSGHTYSIWAHNVTIRGSTGNRDDVVLWGGGMNNSSGVYEGLQIYTDDVTVSDLTLSGFYNHAVHFQPGADRSHINNVRTLNIGQQHMKGGTSNPNAIVGGLIENCLMEQNIARTNHPILNYTGGIDLLGAADWVIRDNVAMNIQGETGEGGGAIFLWQKIVNPIVERNIVIDCDRGIAMGNPGYLQADNLVGGIVRNNFVSHANEVNLELVATTDLKVYNNSLWGTGGSSYNRCVNIYGTATSGLDITNNIIHGLVQDYGVTGYTLTNNVQGLASSGPWFVDMLGGDLHLTDLAIGAIDQGLTLAEVTIDIDGEARPAGLGPDIGADEYDGEEPPPPPPEDVWMDHEIKYVNGKYGITFILRCDDGVGPTAMFAEMVYEGANGGQLEQVSAFGTISVDDEVTAAMYDGIPAANYDKDQDSWFMDEFAGTNASVLVLNESLNFYEIESGTAPGETYEDLAHAYIVCTGDVAYTGQVARAEWWNVVGVLEVPPPGDANWDDYVDGLDYVVWSNSYLQTDVGWDGADFNGDGVADGLDYVLWSNFYSPQPGGVVPEPACGVLLVLGILALRRRRA